MSDPDRAALAQQYRDIFEVDQRGAALFEDLFKRFGAPRLVHTEGGIDAVLKTYRAAGHREVLDYIVRMCNVANGVDDPDPQQPDEAAR